MIPIEREVNQCLWEQIMGTIGYDETVNNDVFEVRLYDWSDEPDNSWHFWHKPSGFKLSWYKYPIRSPEANMEITHEQFLNILKDCHNSMESKKRHRFIYDVDKWWSKECKAMKAGKIVCDYLSENQICSQECIDGTFCYLWELEKGED